jgi:zinc transport system substrate-binding protein
VPPEFQIGNRTIDPHIWLDPVDAMTMVRSILQGFIEADPTDSTYFTANADGYGARLQSLNRQFESLAASNLATRGFVTFHTAFGYLAQRYNLTQIPVFGPFEEEPTAAEISNVVSVINSHHLLYVGYESLQSQAIPAAIASQTNATLLPMNPIEGLSPPEAAEGQTYLTLMAQTLLVLTLALNNLGT